jgi:hypothetical protein
VDARHVEIGDAGESETADEPLANRVRSEVDADDDVGAGDGNGPAEQAEGPAAEFSAGTEPASQTSAHSEVQPASALPSAGDGDVPGTPSDSGVPDESECEALHAVLDADEAHRLQGIGERVAHILGSIAERSDNVLELPEATDFEGGPTRDAHAVLSEVRGQSNALRARLRTQLEAAARSSWFSARRGIHLDARRLYWLAFSDTRVFRPQANRVNVTTAVPHPLAPP